MNLENIKMKYVEIGIPLMLTGIIIMAIGQIFDYLTRTILNISYPIIIFMTLLGMLFTVIGAVSFLFIVGELNNEL